MIFDVTYNYFSYYEDESENLKDTLTTVYEADSEEELDEILNEDGDWDDECVLNWDAKSELGEVSRDWVSSVVRK